MRSPKSIVYYLMLIVCCVSIISCSNSPFNAEYLVGEWKVQTWVVENTGETRTSRMDMSFEEKKYSIDYGRETEQGVYWLMGEFLHTIEKGAQEKKVKLVELSQDTMIMLMNRGGEIERVLLTKEE